MGGGGGIDPVSLIGSMVFGSVLGPGAQASGGRADNSAAEVAAAETARQEAEARQKADRKKAEAALLAKARQAERASQAAEDGGAASASLGGADLRAWEVQAGSIHCDETGPLQVQYVRRVDDPRLFDPLLCEALTARLSATLAYPVTASTSLAQAFWSAYADKLREARGVDAREGAPVAAPAPTSWLAAKMGR